MTTETDKIIEDVYQNNQNDFYSTESKLSMKTLIKSIRSKVRHAYWYNFECVNKMMKELADKMQEENHSQESINRQIASSNIASKKNMHHLAKVESVGATPTLDAHNKKGEGEE